MNALKQMYPIRALLLCYILVVSLLFPDQLGAAQPESPPTIHMARATWDTGWFQAEIFRHLFEELGYRVEGPRTMDNQAFYVAVAQGEVDLWVNGWFPLHDSYISSTVQAQIAIVGDEVQSGALQGYQVDRKSSELLNITSLADFKRPEVVTAFDRDDNGRADLIGCNPGWACADLIEHHFDQFGLRETVEHIQGDYSPLMLDAIARIEQGEPMFFYTWTPNWTVGALRPGEDVLWIEVPPTTGEESKAQTESLITVPNVKGCMSTPCAMGFPPNDIRAVANQDFLAANPLVHALLEEVKIPLADITAQNARMLAGEDDRIAIAEHARVWIAENRGNVERWLATARATDPDFVMPSSDRAQMATSVAIDPSSYGTLRVVTKQIAPFVTYNVQERNYSGFSIELWEQIAAEAGFTYDLYSVNSIAKLLDEVDRGVADVAVAGIGITSQRESYLNFSHAYFESGLQILIPNTDTGQWQKTLMNIFSGIFSPQLLSIFGLLLIALLVAAHVLWYFERRTNPEFSRHYWPGIWEAFWWSAVTATTVGYGDKTPKTAGGRIIALIWMFAGLFVLASFTASVAANFALQEVTAHIAGPEELPGKRVGTIDRSTAAEYLARQGIATIVYEREEELYDALQDGSLDAIVYDAPVLQHYATHGGAGKVQTAGLIFHKQDYGVALADNSPHEEAINLALLRLVERGEYRALYEKWFGTGN